MVPLQLSDFIIIYSNIQENSHNSVHGAIHTSQGVFFLNKSVLFPRKKLLQFFLMQLLKINTESSRTGMRT